MAIDASIPLQAKTFTLSDLLDDQQARQAHQQALDFQRMQMDAYTRQQQEAQRQQSLADLAKRNQKLALQQASTGDYAGAEQQYGLGAGNMDVHKLIAGLQDEHRSLLANRARTAAPIAITALQTPDIAARKALIQSHAQQLLESGWKPEEIASFEPTDDALKSLINDARSVDDALKLYDQANKPPEPFTLGQDQVRYDGQGHEIARGPESIKAITTPEGGTTTIFGGAGHTGITGGQHFTGHVGPQIESTVTGLVPGVTVTSRQRSADHNAAVGGVGNSYHLTDNARDFVPPAGMSMGQLASAIRAKMPGYDVINEGNHVHVEPGPSMTRGGGGPITIHGAPKQNPDDASPLSPDAIDYVAQQYAATGQMPPLGMGKQAAAMRAQIIGRAAVLARQQGLSGTDAVGVHADTKANTAALVTLQRTANQVLAYENTANANAELVLRTMGKGAAGSGIPVLNAWIQKGRNGIGGSADVARFNVAVQTFATEYARVVSGATGGAVTSDSARHEIMSMINNAQTPDQLRAVIQQARAEMANRKKGLADQANALRSQLRGSPQAGGQSGNIPTLTPAQARSAPKGTRFRTTDGRIMVRQ